MGQRSAHVRALRDTVEAILVLQSCQKLTSYESIAEEAELSSRHVAGCIASLVALGVITYERDPQWRGAGVRYSYTVNKEVARAFRYLRPAFEVAMPAAESGVLNAA